MFLLENENYRIELADRFDLLTLRVKDSDTVYTSPAPFRFNYGGQYTFRLHEQATGRAAVEGSRLTVDFDQVRYFARYPGNPFRKPAAGPDLRFHFEIELSGRDITFRIGEVANMNDEELIVEFPAGLFSFPTDRPGEAVIPVGYGTCYRLPESRRMTLADGWGYSSYTGTAYHLPLFGAFSPDRGGLGCRIVDYWDRTISFGINDRKANRLQWDLGFRFERDLANYPRTFVVRAFAPGESYPALAAWYRESVYAAGRLKTLREKIAESPDAEKLVGAVIWKENVYHRDPSPCKPAPGYWSMFPNRQTVAANTANWSGKAIFRAAQKAGFDRLAVFNMGWNFGGFDHGWPRRFPINAERGTEAEMAETAAFARSLSPDFIYSVHDNYHDCYADSPEFRREEMVHDRRGAMVEGGIWVGGRARFMCTKLSMKYAQRDIPRLRKIIGRGGIYVDVLSGCARLQSCHHPDHPQGRRGDAESRRALFQYVRSEMGSLASESNMAPYCIDVADLGAFSQLSLNKAGELDPLGIPIPLWQLIFHDVQLCYAAEDLCGAAGPDFVNFTALYNLLPAGFDADNLRISREMRGTYLAPMIGFRELVPPEMVRDAWGVPVVRGVRESVFADGTRVIANFTDAPYTEAGVTVPPHRFHLEGGKK